MTVGGDHVDTSKQGYYVVTYDVKDSDGNSAEQVIRRIDVYDKENQVNHIPPDLFLY